MMDIVYILGTGSKWQNLELRYSLRSLEKYVRFNRVFIIGKRPEFLNGVVHVPCSDPYESKARNIAHKLNTAAGQHELTERFLFLNDDYFFTEDFDPENYPYFYKGDLRETLKGTKDRRFAKYIETTLQHLTQRSLPTLDFDVHFPIVYEKTKIRRVFERYIWGKRLPRHERAFDPVFKSLYCNTFWIKGIRREDCKARNRMNPQQWRDFIKNKEMFSIGDACIDENFKQFLGELYPEPSRFEKL